jgi:cytochrome c553
MFALQAAALSAHAQDDTTTAQLAQQCFACHGPNGNSQNPVYPVLAGQDWRYIYNELMDYQAGRRTGAVMSAVARTLTRDQAIALGNYFAAQKQAPLAFTPDAARVQAGHKIADTNLCTMCHLGDFVGQNEIPRVAGQWPQYVTKQLEDFRSGHRHNDGGSMTSVAHNLTDEDIADLAQYVANLN